MNINEMLNDSSFLIGFEATSKKHILNELCKLANKNSKGIWRKSGANW